jgi:hypothetical protein
MCDSFGDRFSLRFPTARSRSSLPPSAHRKAVFLLVVRYREIPLMMPSRDPVEELGRGGSVVDW